MPPTPRINFSLFGGSCSLVGSWVVGSGDAQRRVPLARTLSAGFPEGDAQRWVLRTLSAKVLEMVSRFVGLSVCVFEKMTKIILSEGPTTMLVLERLYSRACGGRVGW